MKTHFGYVDRANESYNQDEWSNTACGLEYTESPLSNNWNDVDCKRCLQAQARMNHHGVDDGNDFKTPIC